MDKQEQFKKVIALDVDSAKFIAGIEKAFKTEGGKPAIRAYLVIKGDERVYWRAY